ncbi:ROK family transcriptional regulator [Corynebacterium sp. zg-331]|uniref:ROK family transcriptional regulator n=1 Tax=unclassified Corynebacterium TaxID=2624378 RepID=UPI00128BEF5C|nr:MULTISPECIES: ROK family transcriptional regulator [unclassified Corynebacterium]MBC3186443.1 ROK family transcriptional regulator [Corynebacterium sp. zg-331]MPV52928.1 ROK family protein [Corynebacterium sp. zg331]
MPYRSIASAFARPFTPAAQCLQVMRQTTVSTRLDLIRATGFSQSTVTRAVSALLDAGYITRRPDLAEIGHRGRPTIPLEISPEDTMFAGIAVGTSETTLGLYDLRGQLLRRTTVAASAAMVSQYDFLEYIIAALHRILTPMTRRLVSVGVTVSGEVSPEGVVEAPNLGWSGTDIAADLRYYFPVPVTVSGIAPAMLAAEHLTTPTTSPHPTLALFADDSLSTALEAPEGITALSAPGAPLTTGDLLREVRNLGVEAPTLADAVAHPAARPILNARAHGLAQLAVELVRRHQPQRLVIAGSAFTADPEAPRIFGASVREALGRFDCLNRSVELRMIPSHAEIVHAITRAAALDLVLRDPLQLNLLPSS